MGVQTWLSPGALERLGSRSVLYGVHQGWEKVPLQVCKQI